MRRSVELQIITEALAKMGPHTPATRIWGRAPGATAEQGADGNVWAGDVHDVALHIVTRLYGRPSDTPDARSPLAQAEDAKRARSLSGELNAIMDASIALASAPWHPARAGDVVHVHYEPAGTMPPYGETYAVEPRDGFPDSLQLCLIGHTAPDDSMTGFFAPGPIEEPLYEAWFEAGPHRLTIVRDGQVVHNGAAPRPRPAGVMLKALGETIGEAERYLELGDPAAALARLRSVTSLPPCGAPGAMPDHADCARWKNHGGAHSPDADYVDPPHACPALPEQLHAVVTVGAKVAGVHFAGLYAEYEAAVDHAAGFAAYADSLDKRYVTPAPGAPGEMVLELPAENERAAFGVQLAVVVPLPVLPDPREADWRDQEGRDACAEYDPDYGKDLDDEDDDGDQDGEDGVAQ
ncbi:hypothetical protein [Streptomyces liliifuscus]|uniref:Uncharacterized protein n=1 Tax=Streptomyces liliifuscus TaxID=2797636 RepID=A0A7T7L200_9ACTN|nr:hypothetical protein [Streptomyces liliifuscus]QQM44978.1 hypothetical protein JEQ17_39975 [Streptomyces liliifuscus]